MNGIIEILNVGTGDTKISFDKNNPEDVERAKKIIPDMIKRGYALFCEINGKLERVESFNPDTEDYIVRMPWETEWLSGSTAISIKPYERTVPVSFIHICRIGVFSRSTLVED